MVLRRWQSGIAALIACEHLLMLHDPLLLLEERGLQLAHLERRRRRRSSRGAVLRQILLLSQQLLGKHRLLLHRQLQMRLLLGPELKLLRQMLTLKKLLLGVMLSELSLLQSVL